MVRVYKRKKEDPSYSLQNLKAAVYDVKVGRMTVFKAAREHNIPYSTIYTHAKGIRGIKSTTKGRPTVLSVDDERKLVLCLKTLEQWGFGLIRKELLEKVGQFVRKNHIDTPFKNGTPGKDWFLSFKKRHQNVEFARKNATDPFIILSRPLEPCGRVYLRSASTSCPDRNLINFANSEPEITTQCIRVVYQRVAVIN
jgi:transposase